MKNIIRGILGGWVLTVFFLLSSTEVKAQPGVSISFQTFYNELSPYGNWISDPDYGYVWAPNVGNDFRPYYTNGRWAMTDYGNMWVSNYNWGWAPFHYGRWTHNPFYGWIWIPGNTWGPAWVTWRNGGGHYGWAPMGPGININISLGSGYYVPNNWWTFVPCGNIYNGGYGRYWRGAGYNNTYIHNTTIINNTYNNTYVYGPRRNDIERVTGRKVNVYNVRDARTANRNAISGSNVNVYRPNVATNSRNRTAAPQKYTRATKERSIRQASPALTGRTAMLRNREEARTTGAKANTNRTTRNSIDRRANRNENVVKQDAARSANSNTVNRRNSVNNRPAQKQIDNKTQQAQRAERQAQIQRQRAIQTKQRAAQQKRIAEARQQQQRQAATRQRATIQRQQQARQQKNVQSPTPKREWRRPTPQRVERQPQHTIQRSPQRSIQRSQPARRPTPSRSNNRR